MEVLSLAFSPDGMPLMAAGEDNSIVLWDTEKQTRRFTVELADAVRTVAYSPDGRYVAAGDMGSCIWVWNAADACEVGTADVGAEVLSVAMQVVHKRTLVDEFKQIECKPTQANHRTVVFLSSA